MRPRWPERPEAAIRPPWRSSSFIAGAAILAIGAAALSPSLLSLTPASPMPVAAAAKPAPAGSATPAAAASPPSGAPGRTAGSAVSAIVLITLDTTRADRLGCYGSKTVKTPNLDALAARGVLFENAVSTAPLTLPAHASLMTGLNPGKTALRDNRGGRLAPERATLAEALKSHGFRTAGFVSAYVLDRRWGLSQGFDTYFDDFKVPRRRAIAMEELQRTGDATVREAAAWIRSNASSRIFVWIHLYDPHAPYTPPEPYASQYAGRPYDGEVAWTDALVGRFVTALQEAAILDRSLIAVLADHGESLGEHGERGHGLFLYEETTRIPFIVAGPGTGAGGRRVKEVVRIVDVAPTLLELAGIGPKGRDALVGVDGRSLAPLLAGRKLAAAAGYSETYYPRIHFGWSELRAIRTERHHFIEAPKAELFDLAADPGERSSIAAARVALTGELRAQLAAIVAAEGGSPGLAAAPARGSPPPDMDEEAAEKLAALGYASGVVATPGKSWRDLPDPKDRIKVYELFLRAEEAIAAGNADAALATLKQLTAADPGITDAWRMLGSVQAGRGDQTSAAASFRSALKANPDQTQAMTGLLEALTATGRADEAIREASEFLRRNPDASLVHQSLGRLLLRKGDLEGAQRAFAEALRLAPDLAEAAYDLGVVRERLSDFPGAESWFRKAFAIDPGYHEAHAAVARRRFAAGDRAGAESELKAALAIDPANATYRKALADLTRTAPK